MRTSINKKSDFDFIVLDNEGNAVDMPSNDFTIDLWTWGSKCRFRASSIGGVLKGCKSDNGKLRVYVDNPGFVPGKLVGEWVSYVSSEEYPDGTQRTCRYISDFGIDMVDGDSTTNEQQVLAMMQYIQGESAYEIACKYGYQGTEEEWLNSLSLESVNAANECRELMAQLSAAEDVRNANEQTRIANEQARVESESGRSYEEDRRADAERTRIHNESVRYNSEKIRQDAENYRITHENSRESNETMRQNSETARVTAEEARVAAEESRQTAEQARETAEVSRAAAEEERKRTHDRLKTAMREYADAESLREEAEAERREAEQYRIEYEQSRQSAEADRLTNERSRATAEQQRVTTENARKTAEDARIANEQARVTAETNRESAETDRADAEAARVEAENARAEEFAGFTATLAAKENVANKVTSINADADDAHYPSAKAVKEKLVELLKEINDYNEFVDDDRYSEVVLSRNKRIVESTDADGNKTIYGNLTVNGGLIGPVIENIHQNLDGKIDGEYDLQGRYAEVLIDDDKKIIESIEKTGKHNFNCGIGIANFESDFAKDDAQYVIVELDADDKIHHAVKKDGTHVFPVGIEVPKKTDIYKGVCINALGDSLSNGFEYMFGCRDSLKMKIGGSMVGGSPISGNGEFAFWKDNRINALSAEAKIILIQGGTNDYSQVGDLDITNTDTNTLCGAFNVMMSKLYYKYLSKVNAYYSDVDYSAITRVENPVKRLPIVVIIPPLAPSPQYEARVAEIAKALVDISMLWGLDIIDARRIGYNVISGAGIDMVHGAKKFFGVLSDKIVSYFTDVAKSMSHLQEQEKPNFRITVNANTFGGKSDAFAAVDDIVYITFSSLPNNVIVEDKDNNTISIEWVDRLTNLACQFKMPNSDVVITIN